MDKALQTMTDNMPEKTGESLEESKEVLKAKAFIKHSEAVNFFKSDFQVTHGFANSIVHLSKDEQRSNQDLVTNQYQGKESLFPIYEALAGCILSFGNDIKVSPKKTALSLFGNDNLPWLNRLSNRELIWG